VKQFAAVLRFTGGDGDGAPPAGAAAAAAAAALLSPALKRPDLRDELYAQLVKQTRGHAGPAAGRAWGLLRALATVAPPSPSLAPLVSAHVHAAASAPGDASLADAAAGAWAALRASSRAGARRAPPTVDEVGAILAGAPLTAVVFFLDGSMEELTCDPVRERGRGVGGGVGGETRARADPPPPPPPRPPKKPPGSPLPPHPPG